MLVYVRVRVCACVQLGSYLKAAVFGGEPAQHPALLDAKHGVVRPQGPIEDLLLSATPGDQSMLIRCECNVDTKKLCADDPLGTW